MNGPHRITCIVNCGAGSNRAAEETARLRAIFAQNNLEVELVEAEGPEVTAAAVRAVKSGSTLVVAVGGDGTLNAVANVLVGTEVALGVVPLGTFNHFAKDMKIPLDAETAIATLATGEITRIDVGEVNGRIFLNNSSLGLYPWLVRQREKLQQAGASKWRAFASALLSLADYYPRLNVRLKTAERHERRRETSFVFIGNNQYEVSGARLGERQMVNRGELWVCRAPRAGQLKLLLLGLQALLGFKPRELETMASGELWIETKSKRARVSTDGEVSVFDSPLHYISRPQALKVMVPAGCAVPTATSG